MAIDGAGADALTYDGDATASGPACSAAAGATRARSRHIVGWMRRKQAVEVVEGEIDSATIYLDDQIGGYGRFWRLFAEFGARVD